MQHHHRHACHHCGAEHCQNPSHRAINGAVKPKTVHKLTITSVAPVPAEGTGDSGGLTEETDDPVSGGCCSAKAADLSHQNADSGCEKGQCCSSRVTPEQEPESFVSALQWKVTGMDCPSCAAKLEKAISAVSGVSSARVAFATEKLFVETDIPRDSIGPEVLSVAKKAGFILVSADVASTGSETASFWQREGLLISLITLMALGGVVRQFDLDLGQWIFALSALLGLAPVAYKAFRLIRSGTYFGIETLMTVAALGALYLGEHIEAAMVMVLFLIGERLEGYAASRARAGVEALMALVPEKAVRVVDGHRETVDVSELRQGDVIEIAPGQRLPADGEIISGEANFDQSAMTGESIPVCFPLGGKIMAGSLAVDSVVQIRITSRSGENAIDRILHLIEQADEKKAPFERFIDRFSRWYTPAMMVLATLVVIIPPLMFSQPWDVWLYRGLAMLLIACPCALVISVPASITSGLATAARRGALIKGGAALEQLSHIDAIAFDKTGTLTEGKPKLTDFVVWPGQENVPDATVLLRLAAAVEQGSHHPLAKAVIEAAKEQNIPVPVAEQRETQAGIGLSGVVNEQKIVVVSAMRISDGAVTPIQQKKIDALEGQGKTVAVVVVNGIAAGLLAWRDNLREDAIKAVRKLQSIGVNSIMLTGDNPTAAAAIASDLGIAFRAGLMPADKVTAVEQLNENARVAMVGDGINDAPAMRTASMGIAMGGGTDVALETADAALTHNRLEELPGMIALARATTANIRQNVTLALGLKGVFLVTSLLGITGLWVAVLADSGATALVTLNALRLLRYRD